MKLLTAPAAKWSVGVVAVLTVFALLFDWNLLREPMNRYISNKTQREFRSSDLDVELGWHPVIYLKDVYFANAAWSQNDAPMARVGSLEFTVSLRKLLDGEVLVPRVALQDAELNFEISPDAKRNWVLGEPSETREESKLLISSLAVTRGRLNFLDHRLPMDLTVDVDTLDPTSERAASTAKSRPATDRYTTRYVFAGHYHDADFKGEALTGSVLSFQESGLPFPIEGRLTAGTTNLEVKGVVADAANISGIDAQVKISGRTLANLYPFLLLPLPASPPYELYGHLTLDANRYALKNIEGLIGKTDVAGEASYVQRENRPLLTATLRSKLLNLPDLGPLVGVTTKASSGSATAPTQKQTATRSEAASAERAVNGDRILPEGTVSGGERLLPNGQFEGGRFRAIDAQADLRVDRIDAPNFMALKNLVVRLNLVGGELTLNPFDVDLADGEIRAKLLVDARDELLKARLDAQARKLRLARLIPPSERLSPSTGTIGVHASLSGAGNSIADLAAKADGELAAGLSKGQISNLIDAAAGLNGGKVITLLAGGDKPIAVRCGAVAFAVEQGQASSRVFAIDTEETRIEGSGGFDLKRERLDITIAPQPKHAGILSLRSPVRIAGSFRNPEFELDKTALALRGGGAIALALVNPLAALLPLIETGPGEDADCTKLMAASQMRK